MIVRNTLLVIAAAGLLAAIGGWFHWGSLTTTGSGGEAGWEAWSNAIDRTWQVINAGLATAFLSGIAAAFVPPRNRAAVIVAASVVALSVAVGAWFFFVVTHLGIR
jgi:hypothetical protein